MSAGEPVARGLISSMALNLRLRRRMRLASSVAAGRGDVGDRRRGVDEQPGDGYCRDSYKASIDLGYHGADAHLMKLAWRELGRDLMHDRGTE